MNFGDLFGLADDFGLTSPTIGPVDLRGVPGGNLWQLLAPIPMTWVDHNGHQSFVIPNTMLTDLASVPSALQSVVSPCGPIKEPAVGHDGLYQYRPILNTGIRITRAEADRWLYQACLDIGGMSHDDALKVYLAVRIGGSAIWHRHDAEFPESA